MSAYPFASSAKVTETLGVLETSNIATTQQTLLQQILVASAVNGGGPAPTPPDTPTNFTATAGDQLVALACDASVGATEYKFYIALEDNFAIATQISESPVATPTVNNIATSNVGNVCYYWVVASNSAGDSAPSASAYARPYITIATGTNVNLNTPTGSWVLSTLFFGAGGNLPSNCVITFDGGTQIGLSLGDGTWYDVNNDTLFDPPISGSFNFDNQTGGSVTIWNGEP